MSTDNPDPDCLCRTAAADEHALALLEFKLPRWKIEFHPGATANPWWAESPSHHPAVRLRESVRRPAATIHSILYRKVTEDVNGDPIFLDPDAPCPGNSLLVCDEASMVDEEIKDDIVQHLPLGASVLFVGDPRQLPPVNAPPGVDLQHPTAMLTTIHRQALDTSFRHLHPGGR